MKNKLLKLKAFMVLLFVVFIVLQSQAQTTARATWALTSNGNASVLGNVTATSIAIGSGINNPTYSSSVGISTGSWVNDSPTLVATEYYEYKITPASGQTLFVNSLTGEHSRSNGDWIVAAYYSLDDFATSTQIGSNLTISNAASTAFSFTGLTLQVPSGVTFAVRIYAWESDGNNRSYRNRNIVISGITCPAMAVTTQPAAQNLCAGNTLALTSSFSNATAYQWYRNGSLISGATGATYTKANSTQADSGAYHVIASNNCGETLSSNAAVVLVNPRPTAVTAAASAASTCAGVGFNLTSGASSNSSTPVTIVSENFNRSESAWITVNNSTGGTPANAAWTLRPNGHQASTQTLNSNDASQFYLSDSDAQGSGSTAATILQSPTFSTVGLSAASLSFFHFYRDYNTSDFAYVEISTNGTNWNALNTYTTTQGGPSDFVQVTTDLSDYLNQPSVAIRFRYAAVWGYYWAIDNVTITGSYAAPEVAYAWISTPAGFTSSVQNPTGVTQTVARSYTVTVANTFGCTATATTTVALTAAAVGGSVSGSATICSGANSGVLTLSGHTGTIVRWESAVSPFTTWTPIAHTAATYTSGTLTQETKFRAVLSGCGEVVSTAATLSFNSTTWNGSAWSNGVPASNKALVIAGNYTSPGSNFDLQGCSLTVQNNAVVTIVPQDSVVLSGALTVSAGSTMTFEPKAYLLQSGPTNFNSGAIVYKANSSPIKRLDYTLWSAPVTGQLLQAFSPLTVSNRFYNYDSNTNFYTVVASPATTAFETAKGVLIRVSNTHSATQPQAWEGTFTGVPNNGTYSIPLANFGQGKRFTLVGNPYPSPIDPEAFITHPNNAASITGTLYMWRKTNGSNKPSYCTFNLGGFISNGEQRANEVASLPYQVIQVGQGFFVEGTGAGSGNVIFDNSMRVDDHTNSFLRTGNTTNIGTVERHRVWLNVTNEAGLFSQAMIGYMTNATNGFDVNYDGKYINDGEVALASLLDSEPYAIQSKGLPFAASDVIPMQFTATTAGTYSIAVDRVDGLFASGQAVYLRDTVTGTVHNLSDGTYSFATESGTFNARFEVVFQASTLGVTDPVLSENQVVIYKTPSNQISINTGNFVMDHVMIYDLAGRLLFQQKDINNSQALIKVGFATEVLLVKIKTQDGKSVTKKVLFPRTTLRKDLKISTIQVAEDE
ncbi:T9SS sorting signal type C domain-containing protein [Flavobacterium sp.]|uniref:T9SS sorting signal type C domain-containing protein n=1 Tax=Flavobacterium sp. TaxID=239 RepID=UPI0025F5BF41|nr:T9SS sorting signal type C domain-containing protein [Flavobacterium sp.]